jgi:hypothetical protein
VPLQCKLDSLLPREQIELRMGSNNERQSKKATETPQRK